MNARFSSKLLKQISASYVATLLAFCMLGTHWVGLAHNVSHLSLAKQTVCQSSDVACNPSIGHSSEVCHLFDALTLAGTIPSSFIPAFLAGNAQTLIPLRLVLQVDSPSLLPYQSQAPPQLIL